MGLSDYLKTLQNQAGLGLVEWAARSEVSRTSLWRWLSGKSLPRDAELESALAVLGADAAVRARAFGLLEAARGNGVLRLSEQTGLPLLDRSHLLAALRERRGWSQSVAAAHVGIPRTSLSNWESGVAWPSTERLHTLCFHYEVTQDEFLALTSPLGGAVGLALGAPLDTESIRRALDHFNIHYGNDVYGIKVVPGLVLAQRLSQQAATRHEAKELLCCTYALLGTLANHSLTRAQAKHYLHQAERLEPTTPEATSQLLLAKASYAESQEAYQLLKSYTPPASSLQPPPCASDALEARDLLPCCYPWTPRRCQSLGREGGSARGAARP